MSSIKNQIMGKTIGEINDVYRKKFTPVVLKTDMEYEIQRISEDEIAFESFTCTNTMKDGIGNITAINLSDGVCSVKCVLRGVERKIDNVAIWDDRIKNIHDRVMITEHIGINGRLKLVATKERILKQDFNFFNFGWESNNSRRLISVDIYTGDSVLLEQIKTNSG